MDQRQKEGNENTVSPTGCESKRAETNCTHLMWDQHNDRAFAVLCFVIESLI